MVSQRCGRHANPRTARAASDGVFDGGDGAQSKIDYQPSFTSPKGGEVFIAGSETYTASWCVALPSDCAPWTREHKTRDATRFAHRRVEHKADPVDLSRDQELPSDIPAGNVSKTADLVLGYDKEGSTSLHLSAFLLPSSAFSTPERS